MPSALTYPGVYVEEIPSGVRTIVGVGTSIAAFVGRAARGLVNTPIVVNSFGDFERQFGGIWKDSTLGYAVRDFFLNGGSQAVIVRLYRGNYLSTEKRSELEEAAKAAVKAGDDAGKKPGATAATALGAIKAAAPASAGAVAVAVTKAAEAAAAVSKATPADVSTAAQQALIDATNALDRDKAIKAAKAKAAPAAAAIAKLASNEAAKKDADAASVAKAVVAVLAVKDPVAEEVNVRLREIAKKQSEQPGATAADVEAAVTASKADQVIKAVQFSQAPGALAQLDANGLLLEARNEGAWGNNLRARVDHDVLIAPGEDVEASFNLTVYDSGTKAQEVFRNVTVLEGPRNVGKVLEARSELVRLRTDDPPKTKRPNPHNGAINIWDDEHSSGVVEIASDGEVLSIADFTGPGTAGTKTGLYALLDADQFNLLCLPPFVHGGTIPEPLIDYAITLCVAKRAMLLIDPPAAWATKDAPKAGLKNQEVGATSPNAAVFFPRVMQADPLLDDQVSEFVPCGIVAGIFARTDATRGVWKAPAGFDATLRGVSQLSVALNDGENGELNTLGINCLRAMPAAGKVVWGARTRVGDDRLASEWKYIPVRRTALYIEESLYRGTHWVVFEPNDEPLWGQIRLNVGAFMNDLYRKGAFQGQTPGAAYFVKCDKETNPQNDVDRGIVNIHVGFAPLKPAEFVVIKLQQIAGQILT